MKNIIAFFFLVTFLNTNLNASWIALDEGTEAVQSYIDFENVWRSISKWNYTISKFVYNLFNWFYRTICKYFIS